MFSHKVKSAVIKAMNPEALAHPIFARLDAHQERIGSDPEIARLRAVAAEEHRREMLPYMVGMYLAISAVWGALGWYLPGLFSPTQAVAGWAGTCLILRMTVRS